MHKVLDVAAQLAPVPATSATASREMWLRHFTAVALAAHTAFRDALPSLGTTPEPGSRPDLGYLMAIASCATAAAVALDTDPDHVGRQLWKLTPEAGALNGEYLDWLTDTADELGINPADLDHRLDQADFRSRARVTWKTPGQAAETPEAAEVDR